MSGLFVRNYGDASDRSSLWPTERERERGEGRARPYVRMCAGGGGMKGDKDSNKEGVGTRGRYERTVSGMSFNYVVI